MTDTLSKLIKSKTITAFYQKRNDNTAIRVIEIGQNKIILLPKINEENLLPEYYLKDRNDNYVLFESNRELEELVSNYIFVNG